jgi:hypothetical protein
MITVKAKDLYEVLIEVEAMLQQYGLSRLCEMYIKKNKLVFHCVANVHYFAYIDYTAEESTEYNIVFRVTENVKLLSKEGFTYLNPAGSVLNIVNLQTSINLKVEDSKLEEYRPPNLKVEGFAKDATVSAVKRIISYSAISDLVKTEVAILLDEGKFQLRQSQVIAATAVPLKLHSTFSVSTLRLLLRFLENAEDTEIGCDNDIILFKRSNASLYVSRKPYVGKPLAEWEAGAVPIINLHYEGMANKIKAIGAVMKQSQLNFIAREQALSLMARDANSSVLANFGEGTLEGPITLNLSLPIEIAVVLFRNLGDIVKVSQTANTVVLRTNTDVVFIPAGVYG